MNTSPEHRSRPRRMGRFALPLAAGLLGALAVPAVADAARPVAVDCDTGDDLQAAIDAARRNSSIEVTGTCVGTYVVSGSGISIVGQPGATLDGGGEGPVITVTEGSTAGLSDLVVTGGDSQALSAVGGIDNRGDLSLTGVTVSGNRAHSVGAFGLDIGRAIGGIDSSGTLAVTDSTIVDNAASAEGDVWAVLVGVGGINNNTGRLDVSSSTISDNVVEFDADPAGFVIVVGAGGINLDGPTHLTATSVVDNLLTSDANDGFAVGGILGLGAAPLDVVSSEVSRNGASTTRSSESGAFGGIAVFDNRLTLHDSTISENTAEAVGSSSAVVRVVGGVAVFDSAFVEIGDADIRANVASAGEAAAVGGLGLFSRESPVSVTMVDSSVDDNVADASATAFGGAFMLGGELDASGVTVRTNTAAAAFVAVGGLTVIDEASATFADPKVMGNTADAATAFGGILVDESSTVELNDGSVSLNTPGNCSFADPVCAI